MKTLIGKCLGTVVLSMGLIFAAGLPAAAKNSHTIKLDHSVVLQGANLPAGRYKVEWQTHSPEATVQFLLKHKLIASAEGRVERRDKTYDADAVVYDLMADGSASLLELRFAGSNKVLVLNH